MGILTRISNALRSPAPDWPSTLDLRQSDYYPRYQINKPVWPTRNISTYTADAFAKIALIFRCVGVTSNALASAPVKVYLDTGGGQREEDSEHALRQLLRRPNPFMGEVRFLATVGMVASATGLCLTEIERAEMGRPVALWPMRTDWLKPIPRTNRAPDWEYTVPGNQPQILKSDDVLPFTYADAPDYRYTGIGPLEIALREWGILNVMTDFLKGFFDSGAVPQFGLVPNPDLKKQYSQAEADTLIEKFKQKSGLANSLNPVLLQGITDVKRLSFDFNELAYTDLRDVSELAICQAFGVPPGLVGTAAGLERNTFSNAETMRRSFYEDTITPLWARLDDCLTLGLLPEFETRPGYSLEFDTSNIPALQDDVTPTWTRAGTAAAQGWVTVNDARREVGLPTVEGGDIFLRSIATVEVPAVEERSKNGNGHALEGEWRVANWTTEKVRVIGNPPPRHALPSGAMYRLPPEQRATIASAAKATIARIGERSAPLLRRFWREQGKRIAEEIGLRNLDPPLTEWDRPFIQERAVDDRFWDEEAQRLREVMLKVYSLNGKAAFDAVSDLLSVDISWDLANPNIQQVLSDLARRVVGISDTTRADVQRVVGDALNEGVTLSELSDRLQGLFEQTYRGRAETVGRTESMVAYNKASTLGYQESGVVASVELADNSAHDEDYGASDGLSCAARDGLIVPLDRVDFHIQAEHPNGSLAVIPVLTTALGEE